MSTGRQVSFARGELTPTLHARVDASAYATGLKTARNGTVMRQGGFQNRPGSEFIAETSDSSQTCRLIPFIFNTTQAYILEFGENYIRVYRDGSLKTTVTTTYTEDEVWELDYAQSADVMKIAHPSHAPRGLTRTSDTSWAIADLSFTPEVGTPTSLSASGTGIVEYKVTAIDSVTGEEGLPTAAEQGGTLPTTSSIVDLSWYGPSGGAASYNIYRRSISTGADASAYTFGYVGSVPHSGAVGALQHFYDYGETANATIPPPSDRAVFASSDNYPSCVAYFQQRLMFGNSNNDPQTVWGSRTGAFTSFTKRSPIQDDDSIQYDIPGLQVNEVRHLLDLNKLVILTAGTEIVAQGNGDGAITPTSPGLKTQSYNGSSPIKPLTVNETALYVQAESSIVRDIGFEFQIDGYRGNDLTIFSSHLVDGYTISDWAFQKTPHSVVWAVRDDGVLLSLTYVREQQMLGWARHDTDGEYESVACIPEGNEYAVYVVVKRTINGSTQRSIERFYTRFIDDVKDMVFMDCAATYDGRNTGATTMTLSGSGWTHSDTLTCTASASTFVSGDVGNEVQLTDSDGSVIRLEITAFTSATVVTVRPNRDVPSGLQATATTDWALAKDVITGLTHLEGETVSVMGDGFVLASPNNPAYATVTVASGQITLDRPYGVVHVGLPYVSDLETLDIDQPQGETLSDKKKLVSRVSAKVYKSRGIFAGASAPSDDGLDGLYELKTRDSESTDDPPDLLTETVEINIRPEWNSSGSVCLRQVDPLPMTILSVMPTGLIVGGGGG